MFFDDIGLELDEHVILSGDDLKRALKGVKDTKDLEVKKIEIKPQHQYAPSRFQYEINGKPVRVIDGRYPIWERIIPTNIKDNVKINKNEINNIIESSKEQAFENLKKEYFNGKTKEKQIELLQDTKLFNFVNKLSRARKDELENISETKFQIELDKMLKNRIDKTIKESANIIFDGDSFKINTTYLGGVNNKSNMKNKTKYLQDENTSVAFRVGKFEEVVNALGDANIEIGVVSNNRPVVINGKAVLMPIKLDAISYSPSH